MNRRDDIRRAVHDHLPAAVNALAARTKQGNWRNKAKLLHARNQAKALLLQIDDAIRRIDTDAA